MVEQRGPARPQEIKVKIPDEQMAGRYANMMGVQHSASEFVMDFAFVSGGVGQVVARESEPYEAHSRRAPRQPLAVREHLREDQGCRPT